MTISTMQRWFKSASSLTDCICCQPLYIVFVADLVKYIIMTFWLIWVIHLAVSSNVASWKIPALIGKIIEQNFWIFPFPPLTTGG